MSKIIGTQIIGNNLYIIKKRGLLDSIFGGWSLGRQTRRHINIEKPGNTRHQKLMNSRNYTIYDNSNDKTANIGDIVNITTNDGSWRGKITNVNHELAAIIGTTRPSPMLKIEGIDGDKGNTTLFEKELEYNCDIGWTVKKDAIWQVLRLVKKPEFNPIRRRCRTHKRDRCFPRR